MADTENNKNSNSPAERAQDRNEVSGLAERRAKAPQGNSPAERAQGNAPALRFPGFTEPWCVSKLKSYLKENKERNKHSEFAKEEVLSVSGQDGIINQIKHLGRSFAGKSVADYHVVRHGNIVYTKSPLKEYPYGIVKYNRGVDGIVSTLYAVYETNNKSDGAFVEYYFASVNRINRYFKPIVRIGAKHDMKIGNEEVLQNTVCFPDIMEQKKIATFLSLLDERIATQRRLIDKLETLIKGIREHLLRNMSGDLVWLSNIAKIYQPQTISSTKLLDCGFPVYGANGIIGYYDTYNHEKEQICITCRGNTCGNVNYSLPKSWITGNAMVVNTDNHSDIVYKRFLYHFLADYNFKSIISGSGQPQIVRSPLQKIKVILPPIKMQTQIANFLDTILHKKDLEYSELELLQKLRQHILQQMFI